MSTLVAAARRLDLTTNAPCGSSAASAVPIKNHADAAANPLMAILLVGAGQSMIIGNARPIHAVHQKRRAISCAPGLRVLVLDPVHRRPAEHSSQASAPQLKGGLTSTEGVTTKRFM